MELSVIIPHIEALVFASEKPLTALEVVEHVNNALGFIEDRATLEQVESAVEAIKAKYDSEFYAFELKQSGGGLQFLTKPLYYKTVAQLNGDRYLKRLSTAALETLAIIAYKQPITKGEIEGLRGVNCDYAVQKLLEKDLVIITGRKENAPGQPLIYGTSKSFMDYFGINSADELPKINEILSMNMVESTNVLGGNPVDEDIITADTTLVVDENGTIEETLVITSVNDANGDGVVDNANEETDTALAADATYNEAIINTTNTNDANNDGVVDNANEETDTAMDETDLDENKQDKQNDNETNEAANEAL
jgi:segregation and condensation protein B